MDMDRTSEYEYVGKTLREAQETLGDGTVIRVMGAGNVRFVGTCDYRPARLNVKLGAENLKFITNSVEIGGVKHDFEEVDGSMDDGIIVEAWWG